MEIKLKEVVSYATRKMRDGETNGVEHWFISPEESKILQKSHKVVAYTKIGEIEYFVTDKLLKDSNLYVIDPEGIKFLKGQDTGKNIKIIYVSVPEEVREERAKSRSDYKTAYRERCKSEDAQFTQFEIEKSWDMEVVNIYVDEALADLLKFIESTYNDDVLYCIVGRTCSGKDTLLRGIKHIFNC